MSSPIKKPPTSNTAELEQQLPETDMDAVHFKKPKPKKPRKKSASERSEETK